MRFYLKTTKTNQQEMGQEDGLVNKVLTFQAGTPEFDPQHLCESQVRWCMCVMPALRR